MKDSNGKRIRESNSRITTWSDGSQTLTIGSEHFELVNIVTPNNYLMVVQKEQQTLLQGVGTVHSKVGAKTASWHGMVFIVVSVVRWCADI